MLKIKNPITGAELQVANQDFSNGMTWQEAKRACSELGSGWRLPTEEELKAIYKQLYKNGLGNFKGSYYWCSTDYYFFSTAWYFSDYFGHADFLSLKKYSYYVRAVRTF
jgi:hypothetical protein